MVFGMGPLELMIILGIALLIFGPKNLPKLGKSLGQTVKNVREGMEGDDEEPKKMEAAEAVAEPAPAAAPAQPAPAAAPAQPAPAPAAAPAEATPAAEVVEEAVQFCGKCGAKNPADAAFCSSCGEKLGA